MTTKQTTANFGAIKDTIYKFSTKVLVNENKNQITFLDAFLKEIKSNPILHVQYLLYKNFENGHYKKDRLAERYINQNLKLIESFDWSEIVKTNKKLRTTILAESHVAGATDKSELYEHIHTLIRSVTQKTFTDIDLAQESFDYLLEYIMKEKEIPVSAEDGDKEDNPKFFDWQAITKRAVSKFNERYNHLNESERMLMKILISRDEDKLNYLADLKKENLETIESLLQERLDDATIEALNKFKAKMTLLTEEVNNTSVDESIINLSELRCMLDDIKMDIVK